MKIICKIVISAALLLPLASCIDGGRQEPEIVGSEVEFVSVPDQWTYISLESGTVVGTGKLGDAASDAAWAIRDDWDIAICDTLLRTNGGGSGKGRGGIMGESGRDPIPDPYQEVW